MKVPIKNKIEKIITDILPMMRYEEKGDYFINQDESCIALLQIVSKDLINEDDMDIEYDSLKWAKLYKTYDPDIKLIAMNFPCNTSQNQEYFLKKIRKTRNAAFRYWLEKDLEDLKYLGENNTTREYYLMLFAEREEEMQKNLLTVETELSSFQCLVYHISYEKQRQILYKLNNKASLVR